MVDLGRSGNLVALSELLWGCLGYPGGILVVWSSGGAAGAVILVSGGDICASVCCVNSLVGLSGPW